MQTRELVIRVKLPRLASRRWPVTVACVLTLGGAALAWAANQPFQKGEMLTADRMNGLLAAIDNLNVRVQSLEAWKGQATADGKFSLGALFVGATATPTTGNAGGATVANSLCAAQYAGSHMCTAEDIVRSYLLDNKFDAKIGLS